MFLFQTGAIKTDAFHDLWMKSEKFLFQTGAIKTTNYLNMNPDAV